MKNRGVVYQLVILRESVSRLVGAVESRFPPGFSELDAITMNGCGGEESMHAIINIIHDVMFASEMLQEALGLPEGETEGWFAPLFRKNRERW
jgi:hypothetical protein